MKELTIEQKVKAYDEVMGRAKKELDACGSQDCDAARQIFRLFPELKESEDERIIERIKKAVESYWSDEPLDEILAWLEKQGEQKPVEPQQDMLLQEKYAKAVDECIYGEQKPADKADSVINILNNENREVQQEDLIKKPSLINLEKDNLSEVISVLDSGLMPSSLERARLIKGLQSIKLQQQHKLAWSEEDKNEYNHILKILNLVAEEQEARGYNNLISSINWFKSLRLQSQWKPSDEQMEVLISEVEGWTKDCPKQKVLESLYNDLKKLMKE